MRGEAVVLKVESRSQLRTLSGLNTHSSQLPYLSPVTPGV